MKIVDDKCKRVTWWNRNYFYLATILIVAANILLFAFVKENFAVTKSDVSIKGFTISGIVFAFLRNFVHASWEQVIFNMVCFFLCGLYLERKTGSFSLILLTAFVGIVSHGLVSLNAIDEIMGFQLINYFMYGYIIMEYLFSFGKGRRNLLSIIYGAVLIVLMYVSMCIDSISPFKYHFYPDMMINSPALYTGLIMGVIVGLAIQVAKVNSKISLKDYD